MNKPLVVTVSQVNRRVSLMLKNDCTLGDIYVKGEISNFVNHYKSGHLYFTLKDDAASLKAVMFRQNAESLTFEPEDGMLAVVRGSLQVFERDGVYQLYATEIQPDGLGGLYLAFNQLKEKLYREGMFEQKRKIPQRPSKICIITAETGAALQDMLNILSRRYPLASVVLIPSLVQGQDAPDMLVKAIKKAPKTGADVIIIGRGGGSAEDLQAFNDERVARALYASEIPTISAVGHETDFTIADFVADLRAPTPSAAAELAVPDIAAIKLWILEQDEALREKALYAVKRAGERLDAISGKIRAQSPISRLNSAEERLSEISERIKRQAETVIGEKEHKLSLAAGVINALSPLNVLTRGYSITESAEGKKPIKSVNSVKTGDNLKIRLADGEITATATDIISYEKTRPDEDL